MNQTALDAASIDVRSLDARARQSLGTSHDAIYQMVARAIEDVGADGRLIDVGCGQGQLWQAIGSRFTAYCGIDAVQYDRFPAEAEFHQANLDAADWWSGVAPGDVVAAVETIEHLENPWAFVRGLARLAVPGGWVVVTTPNQLSVLSLMTLATKQRFSSFQDSHFPAHRTALLEVDLARLAADCGLDAATLRYSEHGRVPLSGLHYPRQLSHLMPRLLSDNVMLVARTRPR